MTDITELDATAQAELVRRGEATPAELVETAIRRLEALDPVLHLLVSERFDRARLEAAAGVPDGPFRGVPTLFKDYMCVSAGDPYYAGMGFLHRIGHVEANDSALARRFRAAGLVPLGRTKAPELALMGTTEPLAFGPTSNPWDTTRSPGGSSGASAAAVAAGAVPVAHGNDGAGSIRNPASSCGLVGLKVTRGRISAAPGPESLGSFAVEGFLVRSVRDAAAMLDALAGTEVGDPHPAPPPRAPYATDVGADPGRLRVGVRLDRPREGTTHPECFAAARHAAELLEQLGHFVEPDAPSGLDSEDFVPATRTRSGASIAAQLDNWSRRTGFEITEDDVEPTTWFVAEAGRATSAPQLAGALSRLQVLGREIQAWWAGGDRAGFDLLVTPTSAEPPPLLGDFRTPEVPWRPLERSASMIAFTQFFNVTGQPAISLPVHWTAEGLPVGAQVVAAYGREDLLLRVASQLEAAAPWADRYRELATLSPVRAE